MREVASSPLPRGWPRVLGAVELYAARAVVPACFAAIVSLFVGFALYLGWHNTLDDTAISLAYAKNLIHGHGLVLTQGADPVEGYSNFLWVLIMAPIVGLHIDGIAASKLVGLSFAVAALVLLALIPGVIARRPVQWLDLFAPALAAVSLPFALWSISGLENGLESFLIVLALYLSMRELNDDARRPWSAAAFVALALTRPEGVVFWFAAIAHRVLLALLGRRQLRRDAIWLAACLLPLCVYHVWHYAYFGELVPNTYYAKASTRSLNHFSEYLTNANDPGVQYLRSFADDYRIVVPLVPFAVASLLGTRGPTRYSLVFLMLAAGSAAVLFTGGDWMPYHRFVSPLLPLFFLCVQQGIRVCASVVARAYRAAPERVSLGVSAIAAIAILALTAATNLPNADTVHKQPYGASYSLIRANGRYLAALAARFGIDQPLVAIPDIGGAAYDTDMSIIDLAGLADAYIAKHPSGPDLTEYVFAKRKPDLISIHETWIRRTAIDQDARLFSDYTAFADEYNVYGALTYGIFIRNDLVISVRSCPEALSWRVAGFAAGQRASLIGPVVGVHQSRIGAALVLDIGAPGRLQIVIPQLVWSQLVVNPEKLFTNRAVCVDGLVQGVLGVPTMTLGSLDSIALEH